MILYGFSGLLESFPAFLPALGTAQDLPPRSLCARLRVCVCVPFFFLRKRHVNVNLVGYLIDTKPRL